MQSDIRTLAVSKKRLWIGRLLSALAVLFLAFDSVIKLVRIAPVAQSFDHLGYPVSLAAGIGLLELVCVVLYVIPRTSVLGAILLTGFLGGATASQVRIGEPLLSHVLFPAYVGLLVWGALYLGEDRLRGLVPLRSEPAPGSGTPASESVPRADLAEARS